MVKRLLFYSVGVIIHIQGGAKSAHEHGQGAELGPPYSKGVLNQHMNTVKALN
ncbi:hypothetical protein J6590_001980 [Homalodisca vitripennis]|nr:hypothetical protein J6590_001980 [Homalodisca vitripennis]